MFHKIYNKCNMLLVTKTQVLLTVLWFAAYIHDYHEKRWTGRNTNWNQDC